MLEILMPIMVLLNLYIAVVLLRIALQWVRADYHNPLSQLVIKLTNLPLKLFYKVLPYRKGVDWAALIFAFVLVLIKSFIVVSTSPLHHLVLALFDFVTQILDLYFYLLVITAIVSWLSQGGEHPVVEALNAVVRPILRPIRRILPTVAGFDFSPVIAIVLIKIIEMAFFSLLF